MAVTIKSISEQTGLSETSIRRYAAVFKEFLPARRVGRAYHYEDAAPDLIERIASAYKAGRSTQEIREDLDAKLPQTVDITPTEAKASPMLDKSVLLAVIKSQGAVFEKQTEILEQITALLTVIEQRTIGNEDITAIDKTPEIQKHPWYKRLFRRKH